MLKPDAGGSAFSVETQNFPVLALRYFPAGAWARPDSPKWQSEVLTMATVSQSATVRPPVHFTGRGGIVDKYFCDLALESGAESSGVDVLSSAEVEGQIRTVN